MDFIEPVRNIRGYLDIIVQDAYTGEIISHDPDHNQIQDWAKQSFSYLTAGKVFCNIGNHGEQVTDIGAPFSVPHFLDGRDGTSAGDIVITTPWTYSPALNGLIQIRDFTNGDLNKDETALTAGASLYPFYPTKMRFGIGGLDTLGIPKTTVPTTATTLQLVMPTFPFVVIDRTRTGTTHITDAGSSGSTTNNQVTFSCMLPGGDASYPYNNRIISEAGLFCDAASLVTIGTTNDVNMRTGLMLAYRTFNGITKNESIQIQFNWTMCW
jgi:hypothetical protein